MVALMPWSSRHRRLHYHWPRLSVPRHWLTSPVPWPGPVRRWAVVVLPGDELVGRLAFDLSTCQLGISLRADRLGFGIGRRALSQVLDSDLLPGFYLYVSEDNERAWRSYIAAGGVFVGSFVFPLGDQWYLYRVYQLGSPPIQPIIPTVRL